MKKAYIIHGWDGYPDEGWFPWLKIELERIGFSVNIPRLPRPEEPRIKNWVPFVQNLITEPDEDTFLIGHSMGCQTIIRYLESLPENVTIGGAVFVAGFLKRLTNIEDEDIVRDVVNEWLTSPLDLTKVKPHIKKSVAIFSDDDQFVPLDSQEEFRDELGSEIIIESGRGHFSGPTGIISLPSALEAIRNMSTE